MANPFLGEIRAFSFAYAPAGWLQCNGQTLSINQYQALFALLGTTYGGNGVQNFQLPDLRGRIALHVGNGLVQGSIQGEELSLSRSHKCPLIPMSSPPRTTAR